MTIKYQNIAVLMGGNSNEREISLESGKAVLKALNSLSIRAQAFDPKFDDLARLDHFDCAFICLHGKDGEDGKIQSHLDSIQLPYTGSNAAASKIGMNKYESKTIWSSKKIPTPKFKLIQKDTSFDEVILEIKTPFFLKASNSGSSLGIYRINTKEEFDRLLIDALKIDDIVFAEEMISGREYTVPILQHKTLPIIEIIPKNGFYDYEAKYIRDDTVFICPANIDQSLKIKLDQLALDAFESIGCSGWGRVDFLVKDIDEPFIIEVNTIPGMTSHSLVPLSAKNDGINFEQLVLNILNTAHV
jgi:D-alanine-D-alanine ligase